MKAVLALTVLAAAAGAWAETRTQPAEAELAARYVDVAHGFSLRPPGQTERRRETSATSIVQWSRRDSDSGAIVWTIGVVQARQTAGFSDINVFAQGLAAKLQSADQLRVEASQIIQAAGRPAIDLHGRTTGKLLLWKRQAWILAEPNRFLILAISGAPDFREEMNRVFQAVLDSMEIVDLQNAAHLRQENLARGALLLESLTIQKLQSVIQPRPQWLLLELKGKSVGFMRIEEAATERDGQKGVQVQHFTLLELPGDQRRVVRQTMFSTADRKTDQWSTRATVGQGGHAQETMMEGRRDGASIQCTVTEGGAARTFSKPLPEKVYLPQALGVLLPRLLDMSKIEPVAFAGYAPTANAFDIRTVTVQGSDEITDGSRKVQAVLLTDQPAADVEASSTWVDPTGKILRIQTPDGLLMSPATREAVLRRFKDADKLTKE